MQYTENLGLKLPEATDNYNVNDMNYNSNKIEETFGTVENDIAEKNTTIENKINGIYKLNELEYEVETTGEFTTTHTAITESNTDFSFYDNNGYLYIFTVATNATSIPIKNIVIIVKQV